MNPNKRAAYDAYGIVCLAVVLVYGLLKWLAS
jgi:hypothetical protein